MPKLLKQPEPHQKHRKCYQCRRVCETPLAQLCDYHWERRDRSQHPRQSGRTFRALKRVELNPDLVLVMATHHERDQILMLYPWLRDNVASLPQIDHWYRGRTIIPDHRVFEAGPLSDAQLFILRECAAPEANV